jgi:tetratricopeptide (TPR) repeat protein
MLPPVAVLAPSPAAVQLAGAQAGLLFFTGHYAEYLATAELAAEMARALGDGRTAARVGYHRANALQILGRMGEALRVSEETVAWAKEAGEPAHIAPACNLKTFIHTVRGEFDLAGYANQQGIATAERQGDALWLTEAINKRDMLHFYMGKWDKACTSMEQALAVSWRLGWPLSIELLALGRHCLATGQWHDAAKHLEEAGAVVGELQVRRRAAGALAELDVLEGRPDVAVARLTLLLDRPGLEEFDVTSFLPTLAWAYLELGESAQAEQTIEQALRRARVEQLRLFLVDALRVQAMLACRQERWTQAVDALEEGLALARAMPYPYAEARLLHVYGVVRAQQEKPEAARERLGAALGIFQHLGARMDIEQVERDLAARATEE